MVYNKPFNFQKYLIDETITYVVQINGKVRARYDLPKGMQKEDFLNLVKEKPQIKKYLVGEIIKTIFVPDKLLNIVVK